MKNNGSIESGLKESHKQKILLIIKGCKAVESAYLFGSRAIGTYKDNSDIDIALVGDKLTLSDLEVILTKIELSTIPYKVDVVIKHKITNENLLKHIENAGVCWL